MKKLFKGLILIILVLFLYSDGNDNTQYLNIKLIENVQAASELPRYATASITGSYFAGKFPKIINGDENSTDGVNAMAGFSNNNTLYTFALDSTNKAMCLQAGLKMQTGAKYRYVGEYDGDMWVKKAYKYRSTFPNKDLNDAQARSVAAAQSTIWYITLNGKMSTPAVKKMLTDLYTKMNVKNPENKADKQLDNIFKQVVSDYKLYKYEYYDGSGWQPLVTTYLAPPETPKCDIDDDGNYYDASGKKLTGTNARANYIKSCFDTCTDLSKKNNITIDGDKKYTIDTKDGKLYTEEEYKAKCFCVQRSDKTYWGLTKKVNSKTEMLKECEPHYCTEFGGSYFNIEGKKVKTKQKMKDSCTCGVATIDGVEKYFGNTGEEVSKKEYLEQCSCSKVGNTYRGPKGKILSSKDEYQKKCACKTDVETKIGKVNCLKLNNDGSANCDDSYTQQDVKESCSCTAINNVYYGKNGKNILTLDEFIKKCGCNIDVSTLGLTGQAKTDYIAKQETCDAECKKIDNTYYLKEGATTTDVKEFYRVCNPSCAEVKDETGYDSNGNEITNTNTYYGYDRDGNPVSKSQFYEKCPQSCTAINNVFYGKSGVAIDMNAFIKNDQCGCDIDYSDLDISGKTLEDYIALQATCPSSNKCKIVDGVYYDIDGEEVDDIYDFFESCNPSCEQVGLTSNKGYDYNATKITNTSNTYQYDTMDGPTNGNSVFGYGVDNRPVDKSVFYDECGCEDEETPICGKDCEGNWYGIEGEPVDSYEDMIAECPSDDDGGGKNPTCATTFNGKPATCDLAKSNNGHFEETRVESEDCFKGYTDADTGYYGSFETNLGEYCKLFCFSSYDENYPGKISHSISVGSFIVWPNNINDTQEKVKYKLEIFPFNITYKKTCHVSVDRKKVLSQLQSEDTLYNAVKDFTQTRTTSNSSREIKCSTYQTQLRRFIKIQNEEGYLIPDQEVFASFHSRCLKSVQKTDPHSCENVTGACTPTVYNEYEFRSEACKNEYASLFEKADGNTWYDLANWYTYGSVPDGGYGLNALLIEGFYQALRSIDSSSVDGVRIGSVSPYDLMNGYAKKAEGDDYITKYYTCDYRKTCALTNMQASELATCIHQIINIQENGYDLDDDSGYGSVNESNYYGAIAKQEVLDELNNCIPNENSIDVNFDSTPTIYYNDPEYGGTYNTKKRSVTTSYDGPTIQSFSEANGAAIIAKINELENAEYTKSKTEIYDLDDRLFDAIYIEDGSATSSNGVSDTKKHINLDFSNLPISYDAKPSDLYNLKVESNISDINEEIARRVNNHEYVCDYEVKRDSDCYCPDNTPEARKNLDDYILANKVTCAEAQEQACGSGGLSCDNNGTKVPCDEGEDIDTCTATKCPNDVEKPYCVKDNEIVYCDIGTSQEECDKKCSDVEEFKCPKDKDPNGLMTNRLIKCIAGGGNYEGCVEQVCNSCIGYDCVPRCPKEDPNIPTENQGMDISACVDPEVANGTPLAEAYEKCKDITCPGKKIIYRVIDLTNPFPSYDANVDSKNEKHPQKGIFNTDLSGRFPGYNWKDVDGTVVKSKIINNRNVNNDEVYNKNPLYKITLTPDVIQAIRGYNEGKDYADFTLNCSMNGNAACRMNSEFTGLLGGVTGDCATATGSAFYTCMYNTN